MTVRTANGTSDVSGANGDRRGMGEEKSSPCPELRKKRKLGKKKERERGMGEEKSSPCPELRKKGKPRKRKRKRAGHGRRKKIPHAPN